MSIHKFSILKDDVDTKTKHYVGLPPEVTGNMNNARLLSKAKLLVICDASNGYELYRYDKNGEFAGDTWHTTEDDVIEQVKFEFALNSICWIDIPTDEEDPISYAIEYMKCKIK